MNTREEVIDKEDSAWPLIQKWMHTAKNKFEVLPAAAQQAEHELVALQMNTHATLGAIVYHTGGLLIDHGWLRILGSGSSRLQRSILSWNKAKTFTDDTTQAPYLLIADDVLGGYFAINAGGLGTEIGKVYYFAPELLEWECLDIGYTDFLYWTLQGDLETFYELFRWNHWQEEVNSISSDQVYSFFPFLWDKKGKNINNLDRKRISIQENYSLTQEEQKK